MRYDDATGVLALGERDLGAAARLQGHQLRLGHPCCPMASTSMSLNRLHDSISLFKIDARTGAPTLVREEWTRGNYRAAARSTRAAASSTSATTSRATT